VKNVSPTTLTQETAADKHFHSLYISFKINGFNRSWKIIILSLFPCSSETLYEIRFL